MTIKKKIICNNLVVLGLISLASISLNSCAITENKSKYNCVTLDSTLSGNLAALGLKPTYQSLYNSSSWIPDYIKKLNINTEVAKQPSNSNAELWLSRFTNLVYGFSYQKPFDLSSYGFKHFLEDKNFYNSNVIPAFVNKIDKNAEFMAKTWSFKDKLLYLATNLNNVLKNKDNTPLFQSVDQTIDSIMFKYDLKIKAFKEKLNNSKLSISFWGQSYGPNSVMNENNFTEYGPSTNYPGWLFDSLGFVPATPSNTEYKLKIFDNGGFNAVGWMPNTGSYNAIGVQKAFENSSDYIVVSLNLNLNLNLYKNKILEVFRPMLKENSTKSISDDSKIILIQDSISLQPYNLLGVEDTINLLATKILNNQDAQIVIKQQIFDTSKLKTISNENFNFI